MKQKIFYELLILRYNWHPACCLKLKLLNVLPSASFALTLIIVIHVIALTLFAYMCVGCEIEVLCVFYVGLNLCAELS